MNGETWKRAVSWSPPWRQRRRLVLHDRWTIIGYLKLTGFRLWSSRRCDSIGGQDSIDRVIARFIPYVIAYQPWASRRRRYRSISLTDTTQLTAVETLNKTTPLRKENRLSTGSHIVGLKRRTFPAGTPAAEADTRFTNSTAVGWNKAELAKVGPNQMPESSLPASCGTLLVENCRAVWARIRHVWLANAVLVQPPDQHCPLGQWPCHESL